jgi:queuine/archaeosine tRNA-ribosyltransferase
MGLMNLTQSQPSHVFGVSTPVLFFGVWALGVAIAITVMVRFYKSRTRSNLRDDGHPRRGQRLPPGPPR